MDREHALLNDVNHICHVCNIQKLFYFKHCRRLELVFFQTLITYATDYNVEIEMVRGVVKCDIKESPCDILVLDYCRHLICNTCVTSLADSHNLIDVSLKLFPPPSSMRNLSRGHVC